MEPAMSKLDACRLIDLPPHHDVRGNLSVIEGGVHIPFDIQRVYYLYDVPGGSARAGHGHIELQQLFVAMSGSFDVIVDDGFQRKRVHMNRSYYGLYVPGMMWREVENFPPAPCAWYWPRRATTRTTISMTTPSSWPLPSATSRAARPPYDSAELTRNPP
jgi:hypothetical protein